MSSYLLARKVVGKLALDIANNNVATNAYKQITAATTVALSFLDIYNGSTKILILAIGGAGNEVDLAYIYPGISSQVLPFDSMIPKGTRVSVKALDANATTGYLVMNLIS
jgi:hypothetical protein